MKRILLSLALLTAAFGLNAQTELVAPPKVTETVDLQIVSCVGYPQSGQVALTITLTPNNFMLNANIAGGWEGRAYDAAGKQYRTRRVKPGGTLHKSDIPQGIPCTFIFGMEGVDPNTQMLKSIVLPYHINAGNYNFLVHSGNNAPIEFRNVPIAWEKPAAKTYFRVPFELMGNVDLNIVSCTGDKTSGTVTIELTTVCNIGGETRMALGDSREDKIYDSKGNTYNVERVKMKTETAPQNTPLKYTFTSVLPTDVKEIKVFNLDYTYSNEQSDWGCRHNADRGIMEIHNIPIEWK